MTNFADMVHPSVASGELKNRFAAKLTFKIRCKLLALVRLGYPASIVAKMYNLHTKTVLTLNREQSSHYRKVRAEFAELGAASFNEKYLTEEDLRHANRVVGELTNKPVSNSVSKPLDNVEKPNKIASQLSGDHMHLGRKINIRWVDGGDMKPGWYYFDYMDEENVGPFKTSKAALQGAKSDIDIMVGE